MTKSYQRILGAHIDATRPTSSRTTDAHRSHDESDDDREFRLLRRQCVAAVRPDPRARSAYVRRIADPSPTPVIRSRYAQMIIYTLTSCPTCAHAKRDLDADG